MSSKRVKYEISFELFHHLVMYIQIASLKLCILPTNNLNVSLISTTCPQGSRHHSLLHPLAAMRHRTGGGICNSGPCSGIHIHIRDTSPDRDVSYLEFVFSSYV